MVYDYGGAFHLHSSYSFDGNVDVPDIIKAARRAGVDFVVITDHFRLDARCDGWEGWHDGVLVIVGEEISPRYNHYLALGITKPVIAWKKESKPQEYIDAVNRQGGFGLIAHPDHSGAPKYGVKSYVWNDWNVSGYTGISIWDMMTDWQSKLGSLPASAFSYLFPSFALSGPQEATLRRWDELNARGGKVLGFGELDNHHTRKRVAGMWLRVFPFSYALSTIRTRILLEEPLSEDSGTAIRQVYAALRGCRAYVAQERWNGAKGFLFRAYNDTVTALPGDEFILDGRPSVCEVKLPAPGFIRIVRNGQTVAEKEKPYLMDDLREPGVYRVEAHQKIAGRYRPWIYSNPIWVLTAATGDNQRAGE